jgi:hypothetical protein
MVPAFMSTKGHNKEKAITSWSSLLLGAYKKGTTFTVGLSL